MQQKYLTLALSAILATALTGCGSDNGNNNTDTHTKPKPDVTKPDATKPDATKPDATKPDATKPDATKPDAGTTSPNAAPNKVNNAGEASIGGQFKGKLSTGGQQYLRDNKKSEFDLVNNPKKNGNDANSTVANFIELQNKKLANIVVGRDTPERDKTTAKYYIGTADETTETSDSLQALNQRNSSVTAGFANGNNINNGLVTNTSQRVAGSNKATDTVVGAEEQQDTSSRIFGAFYRPGNTNTANNSQWLPIVSAEGTTIKPTATSADNLKTLPKQIKLNNVQYGRVTANLDPLTAAEKKNVVDDYFKISPNNTRIVGRAADNAVSQYFYRGINRTTNLPTSGVYQYAGQALMYGIDNSYHQNGANDPNSNAIALPDNGGTGVGNFVHATVDMGKRNVTGQVYNVWSRNDRKGNDTSIDTLVTFNGKIVDNSNSVSGSAELAYTPAAGISKNADFQASFYGSNAEELGGAFNSVRKGANDVGTYGKEGWGGVFGAKQITTKAPIITDNNGNQTE